MSDRGMVRTFINGDGKNWAVFSVQLVIILALVWYSVSNLKDFPARLSGVEAKLTTHEAVQDVQNKDLNDRLDRIEVMQTEINAKLDNLLLKMTR